MCDELGGAEGAVLSSISDDGDLMRLLPAKAFCPAAAGLFSEHWPRSMHRDLVTKHFETMDYDVPFHHAAIAPGTTTDAAWAGPREEPSTFRIFKSERSEPMLMRIETPQVFRSYVMFYDHHVVFLPRHNDHTLYERLAHHPGTTVNCFGTQYPWPTDGPTFLYDHRDESATESPSAP